ncbi:hypothetical protein Pan241w_49670 [Gimesia alba]|uniref:Uncharacterized protein n=1 Tax=Gimesia alba TaxID=2527973 RepID=A0A517RLU1_9PLAN|nr:hypothetical protein Pan241w_49670 [Gimesia alba]
MQRLPKQLVQAAQLQEIILADQINKTSRVNKNRLFPSHFGPDQQPNQPVFPELTRLRKTFPEFSPFSDFDTLPTCFSREVDPTHKYHTIKA